jgi:restriction endonuclease S subunit
MRAIRSFSIPIPPLVRQRAFADSVEKIRLMEAQQAASHSRLESLL